MPPGIIQVRFDDGGFIAETRRLILVASAPFRAIRQRTVRAMRDSVERDFRSGGYHTPTGGFQRWPGRKQWGSRSLRQPPMRSVHRKWKRSEVDASDDRIALVIRGPEVELHAGGSGTSRSRRITRVRARRRGRTGRLAMQVFHGVNFGVWIREQTLLRGLEIPSRPHAAATPQLAEELEGFLAERIGGRAA